MTKESALHPSLTVILFWATETVALVRMASLLSVDTAVLTLEKSGALLVALLTVEVILEAPAALEVALILAALVVLGVVQVLLRSLSWSKTVRFGT